MVWPKHNKLRRLQADAIRHNLKVAADVKDNPEYQEQVSEGLRMVGGVVLSKEGLKLKNGIEEANKIM
jgi:hypothetical protein